MKFCPSFKRNRPTVTWLCRMVPSLSRTLNVSIFTCIPGWGISTLMVTVSFNSHKTWEDFKCLYDWVTRVVVELFPSPDVEDCLSCLCKWPYLIFVGTSRPGVTGRTVKSHSRNNYFLIWRLRDDYQGSSRTNPLCLSPTSPPLGRWQFNHGVSVSC